MAILVERDYKQEQEILNKLKNYVTSGSNRNEDDVPRVHVSSLLWCLRQSYYNIIYPSPLGVEEIIKFSKGKVSEAFLTSILGGSEKQERIEKDGIVAHPDIMIDDVIIELKQTDKFSFIDPRDTVYNSFVYYLTQLLYYMYLARKTQGYIIVNHSNYNIFIKKIKGLDEKDKNPFRVFSIYLHNEEEETFDIIKNDLEFKKGLLEKAIKEKNVGFLPTLKTVDVNDTNKCNICAFKDRCGSEADYWNSLKIDKVLKREPSFLTPLIQQKFNTDYYDIDIENTDVNYLYKKLNIKFGELGIFLNK